MEIVKNVKVHLDGEIELEGDATFDENMGVIKLDSSDESRYDNSENDEVLAVIPYSRVLYWAVAKETNQETDEEDEKVTGEELEKAKKVAFFDKIFGRR